MEPGISALYAQLRDLSIASHEAAQYELYRTLEDNKPRLLALFNFGPRDSKERQEVELGRIAFQGERLLLNDEFKRAALALSEQLNVSEVYCAQLLHIVAAQYPNANAAARMERAVVRYHDERWKTVRSLLLIFAATEDTLLYKFRQELAETTLELGSGRRGRFAEKILVEIDQVTQTIAQVSAALMNATTVATADRLGHGTLALRIERLRDERRLLGSLLHAVASNQGFSGVETSRVLDWLQSHGQEEATPYVFAAALLALDTTNVDDGPFIENASRTSLADATVWKVPSLKAAVLLQWSLLLRRVPNPREDTIEKVVWSAVLGDAFGLLRALVVNIPDASTLDTIAVDAEFKPLLLRAIEKTLVGTIAYMSPVLRRIKHKQEDVTIANARNSHANAAEPEPERQDIAALYELIGQLYLSLPDNAAVSFWVVSPEAGPAGARLSSFVRWAAESRDAVALQAAFVMISGISKGRDCAEYSFNFITSTGNDGGGMLSWSHLFGALEQFHSNASSPGWRPQPQEVFLLISFLKILKTMLQTMLQLVPSSVPLELKNALLNATASFCLPGGSAAVEICRGVWSTMDRIGVVRGVERELESVEAPGRVYPSTGAFIRLLGTLLHTPKQLGTLDSNTPSLIQTVPETLNVLPYTNFVVDGVLLRVSVLAYQNPVEKWSLMDGCLAYVEHGLAAFDPATVLLGISSPQQLSNALQHPGVDVLARMLHDTSLRSFVLAFVDEGANASLRPANRDGAAAFDRSLVRALRIVHRTLEIQQPFIDDILPLAATHGISIGGVAQGGANLGLLDDALVINERTVVQIALYATRLGAEAIPASTAGEMTLLAVRILSSLAHSSAFRHGVVDRLSLILLRSEESLVVSDGFVRLLKEEDRYDLGTVDHLVEPHVGAGAVEADEGAEELDLAPIIKSAVLDLLLSGTSPGVRAPNVAHFLLGYATSGSSEATLQDPSAEDARLACAHIVLLVLEEGVPRLDARRRRRDEDYAAPLHAQFPSLAEKYYRLVRQLCAHDWTASSTIRYLRTREDFFARQLAALPPKLPAMNTANGDGLVVFEDGSSVRTDARKAAAFIRLHASIFELVALELHVLTETNQVQRAGRLLKLIFGTISDAQDDGVPAEFLQPFALASGSLTRIVEHLHGLALEWVDNTKPEELGVTQLTMYDAGQFDACLRFDEVGCQVYDEQALVSVLAAASARLGAGALPGPARETLRMENRFVLESVGTDNRRRAIGHARSLGFTAWSKVIAVALAKGQNSTSEGALFEMLHAVPPALRRMEVGISAEALAESLVALVSRLRANRNQQVLLQAATGAHADDAMAAGALPIERLLALFRSLIECVLVSGAPGTVRGNTYSALVSYLQLVDSEKDLAARRQAETTTLDHTEGNGGRSELETGTLAIINAFVDRLVPTVCKDATDGAEVWKTVAFTLLDTLVRLSRTEKRHAVLQSLTKSGYLSNFVLDLKRGEEDLFRVVGTDPDDLNALYVYEAKMALLIRLAQTRQGADEVFKSKLFPTLSSCEFLDARPDADDAYLDDNSFLPTPIQRYHQVLLPALQLVDSVLSSSTVSSAAAAKQALAFVLAHRETVLAVLRDASSRVTLSILSCLQLVVALCSFVVPHVPPAELTGYNGFGGVHAAVLSLSAKFLASRYSSIAARPMDESELVLAQTRAPGYGVNQSVYEVRLYDAVALLRKWCIVYLATASRCGSESGIQSVLLMASPDRESEMHPTARASGPTISDAIAAVSETMDAIEESLHILNNISTKLAEWDGVGIEEVDEIAEGSGLDIVKELDGSQRRLVAFIELEQAHGSVHNKLLGSLHNLEMLVLLVSEHLQHAHGQPNVVRHAAQLGMSTAGPLAGFGFLGGDVGDALLTKLGRSLSPIIDRLANLPLLREVVGADAQARQKFLETMCRRIQDATAYRSGSNDADSDDDAMS
ncbi:nucleoporin Nup186/Nup192/Nup205 [Auriculariales sp. MPI-PUGE-AT-0066]|nr:nucleoporin Nup186/Nup192/Nup205 [Auriculariales sp. MPI-PUGE-AT-0066]